MTFGADLYDGVVDEAGDGGVRGPFRPQVTHPS